MQVAILRVAVNAASLGMKMWHAADFSSPHLEASECYDSTFYGEKGVYFLPIMGAIAGEGALAPEPPPSKKVPLSALHHNESIPTMMQWR